jgi:hypothetical protein
MTKRDICNASLYDMEIIDYLVSFFEPYGSYHF